MIEVRVTDERPKVGLVNRKCHLGRLALLRCPSGGIQHDREPSHHPAAQHVQKILNARRRPFFHVRFQHRRRQDVAGVIKCPSIRQRIIGIRNREIITVSSAAEINHAATVVANFQKKAWMARAQIGVNGIVSLRRVVADVGRIGTFHPVRTGRLANGQV